MKNKYDKAAPKGAASFYAENPLYIDKMDKN